MPDCDKTVKSVPPRLGTRHRYMWKEEGYISKYDTKYSRSAATNPFFTEMGSKRNEIMRGIRGNTIYLWLI